MKTENLGSKNGMAHLSGGELLSLSPDGVDQNFGKTNPKERYEQKNKTKTKTKKLPPVGKLSPDDGSTYRFL
jgi:hypothetical protein